MIARSLGLVTLAVSLSLWAALSFGAPAGAADPLSFDDPGIHFAAPAGWTRIGGDQPSDPQGDGPAAVFVYHQGQTDQRSIVIAIAPFDGTLDDFESHHESEIHSSSQDATYVEKRTKTALANGMPAYFLRISSGTEAGHFMRRYEYLVIDGKRSIAVTLSGRQGDFDEKDAQAALASLYVVAYPRARP